MGGRPLEGPTMVGRTLDWNDELGRWLKPFVDRLGHKARRRMCPLYVSGLIGPGDRKSVQPMAKRLVLGEYDQLHHFIAAGVWEASPVAGKKESTGRRLSQPCPPCARPSSKSSLDHLRGAVS